MLLKGVPCGIVIRMLRTSRGVRSHDCLSPKLHVRDSPDPQSTGHCSCPQEERPVWLGAFFLHTNGFVWAM